MAGLLARFEVVGYPVTVPGQPDPKNVVTYSQTSDGIEVHRIDRSGDRTYYLGVDLEDTLLTALKSVELPKIDYQTYFDNLSKSPSKKRLRLIAGESFTVEVELQINGTHAKFRMRAPELFFYNHSDDNVVAKVQSAMDAFMLVEGRKVLFF